MNDRITKALVDSLRPRAGEYTLWDGKMPGFGVRVRPSGAMSYVVAYRAGSGRGAPTRRYTIGNARKIAPEAARTKAQAILGEVADGGDPASSKAAERSTPTVSGLADKFLSEHVDLKRKPGTAATYRYVIESVVKPRLGATKADKLTRSAVAKLHADLRDTPSWANRALAVVSSMYSFGARSGLVAEGTNPARGISKFSEHRRERFLTVAELERLGAALRQAETKGIPWSVDESKPKSKHLAKADKRFRLIDPYAVAAIRLLIFTGCRLREVLHMRWEHVDLERSMLFLPDSKTGKKPVILNAPAMAVLAGLHRQGPLIIPGSDLEKPRADLKRPWQAVAKHAGLEGVRIHDLRHTFASYGAGGGLGLPIIGKLLGHAQPSTTARYAHLDNDPLKRAANQIGNEIAAAMGEHPARRKGNVVRMKLK